MILQRIDQVSSVANQCFFSDNESEASLQNAAQSFCRRCFKKVDQLYEAGIDMNGQIVLCKGFNDGEELEIQYWKPVKIPPVLQKCFCRSGRT